MWDINATPQVCILLVYNTLMYYVYTFYAGCKDLECQDNILWSQCSCGGVYNVRYQGYFFIHRKV